MTTHRISPKAGWVSASRLPKGPNGRALCRRCAQEVPKGRLTFCSDECVHQWKITTNPGYVRNQLYHRDRGVCGRCDLDTDAIERTLPRDYRERRARLRELGFNRSTSLWEAHHKVAVVEGGGECGLDGYETLCWRCHRDETAALAKRRADARKVTLALAEEEAAEIAPSQLSFA